MLITIKRIQYNMSNSNMNKFQQESSGTIDVEGEHYDNILSKCRKNKSNTCRSVIADGNKHKIYMDDKENLYFQEHKNGPYVDMLLRRVACLEEIKEYEEAETTEAEDYKELLEFCINNIRDTENNSISDFRKMKWATFCEKSEGAHILTEALTEYQKRKRIEELKEDIEKLKQSLVEKEEKEEEEEEYEYNACSISKIYKVVINVAGGGMMNGNAYANIEGEWETEEEYETGEEGDIYYCEYGNNPVRRYVGTRIVWGEDDNFNVE